MPRELLLRPSNQGWQRPALLEHAEPPERISPIARELWIDISTEMTTCGLLSPLDLTGFEMLCECYADWAEARAEVAVVGGKWIKEHKFDKEGNITATKLVIHPAVQHYQHAERSMRAWLDAFGLTPSSRLRWERGETPPPTDETPLDLSAMPKDQREALREMLRRRLGEEAVERSLAEELAPTQLADND